MPVRLIVLCCFLSLSMVTVSAAATTQTTNTLNLRSGTGVHYDVVAVVPTGASINILSCGPEWCNCEWGGYKGYVEGKFLLSHVTEKVSPLNDLKPAVASEARNLKELQEVRLQTCESQWGVADLDGDGVLSASEIAHYNSSVRSAKQPDLVETTGLAKKGFLAECAEISARE